MLKARNIFPHIAKPNIIRSQYSAKARTTTTPTTAIAIGLTNISGQGVANSVGAVQDVIGLHRRYAELVTPIDDILARCSKRYFSTSKRSDDDPNARGKQQDEGNKGNGWFGFIFYSIVNSIIRMRAAILHLHIMIVFVCVMSLCIVSIGLYNWSGDFYVTVNISLVPRGNILFVEFFDSGLVLIDIYSHITLLNL